MFNFLFNIPVENHIFVSKFYKDILIWMPLKCNNLYQIRTAFNKLKIMSAAAHGNWKKLKVFEKFHSL
jgi:hypothetical protein